MVLSLLSSWILNDPRPKNFLDLKYSLILDVPRPTNLPLPKPFLTLTMPEKQCLNQQSRYHRSLNLICKNSVNRHKSKTATKQFEIYPQTFLRVQSCSDGSAGKFLQLCKCLFLVGELCPLIATV